MKLLLASLLVVAGACADDSAGPMSNTSNEDGGNLSDDAASGEVTDRASDSGKKPTSESLGTFAATFGDKTVHLERWQALLGTSDGEGWSTLQIGAYDDANTSVNLTLRVAQGSVVGSYALEIPQTQRSSGLTMNIGLESYVPIDGNVEVSSYSDETIRGSLTANTVEVKSGAKLRISAVFDGKAPRESAQGSAHQADGGISP